jgi:peptidoglycan/LPS O-acetylase OafA/YrhL
MRFIDARTHAIIDVVLIFVFVLAPTFFGLGGSPQAISYIMALLFLLLLLLTRYPAGRWKTISFFVHGIVEIIVGVALVTLPSYGGYAPGSPARRFYIFVGAAILVVWALTNYGSRGHASDDRSPRAS